MAKEYWGHIPLVHLAVMNSAFMGFSDRSFDLTICIQNGISAFAVDQKVLFQEAVRVTKSAGIVLFSSYSERFWNDRLEWFEAQSANGLIGPIDHQATGNGVIVCKDGFRATTVDAEGFRALASAVNLVPSIVEVDNSSIFCEIVVK
jgi:ubiquinone/menaquinone biosynthesis C-methylase UbiE